ncbi:ARM repeat-containing protein [Clavulina sp. PMI_390]|nr:ARM repeat-containing protein [Clavulina sp. PMI_390]
MSAKRSAPSSTSREHPSKKRAVSNGQAAPVKRSAVQKPATKTRRKPVTISESDQDQEPFSDEDGNDEFPEGLEHGFGDEGEESAMDVDGEPAKVKDPNAAKESHKLQKETLRQRQAAKPHADLLADAKRHWSLARQRTLPKTEREKHITKLLECVKGRIQDLVFKHDASRVVQTIVKSGGPKEREQVGKELKGRYRELAQNKYAKFLIPKLLRYCPSLRPSILSEFHDHVMKLLLHREASPIIADAYELYANAPERDRLLLDLFGKEAALFQPSTAATSSAQGPRGLQAVLLGADSERRKRVLSSLKDNLTTIFNNPDKGAVAHAIVHRALWEYLQEINSEEESDLYSCQELVAEMVHTKEGSRAVREFLACGSAKDRKQIIKVLKPHIERMCKDEEAQLVLYTALDVVDDTKLLAKSIVLEITQHARDFAFETRRPLFYLLVPRSSRHFPPALTSLLAETDAARARTSKKDVDVRQREIRVAASEGRGGLLHLAEQNMDEMMRDTAANLMLTEILLSAEGDRTKVISALVSLLRKTYPTPKPSNGELSHIIDLAPAARLALPLRLQGRRMRTRDSELSMHEWALREQQSGEQTA